MTRKTSPSTGRLDPNVVRRGVLNHSIAQGVITADQREAWDRLLKADLHGSIETLNQMAAQKRAVNAAVRRGSPDEIVARACAEGRFSAERAAFWRAELDRDPVGTEKLLTEPPERGGLVASLVASGPPELTAAQEDEAHRLYMTSHFKGASARLGIPGGSSRWSVQAREGRVRTFTDRG